MRKIYGLLELSFLHSCFSRSFGKWLLSGSKKLFAVVLTIIIFLSSCIPAFASDMSIEDYTVEMRREVTDDTGNTTSTNFSFTKSDVTSHGVKCYKFMPNDYANFWKSGGAKFITAFTAPNMVAGHEYELSFYCGLSFNARFVVCVYYGSQKIYETTFSNLIGAQNVSISLTAPEVVSAIDNLTIELSVDENYGYGTSTTGFFISKEFEWNDTTDNPGWLENLLNKIKGFFEDLYQNIINGIKSLFVPGPEYFETKKTELETFCTEHFGALYQVPEVMVDFLKKFTTMSPQTPSITVPAIEFDFKGTRYVLAESTTYSFSWVNDSSNALYYFYQFYRGFVTLILFISFGNYCIKKYNEIFAGGNAE